MGTVKYSGPIASFHCPTEATIRSLKVHFSPKQEGSGNPSPENIRPIEGWDGVSVHNDKDGIVIPEEYQKVEYLESDGGQYFWTDINVQEGLTVESVQSFLGAQDNYLFGGTVDSANNRSCFNGMYNKHVQGAYPNNYYNTNHSLSLSTVYRIKTTHKDGIITVDVDGVSTWTQNRSGTIVETGRKCICFGASNGAGDVLAKYLYRGRVYSLTVRKDENRLANFIPCRRKSDGKPGMYDTVSGEFFTNQGTGEFICGPDVGETIEYEFGVLGKNKLSDNIEDYTLVNAPTDIIFSNGSFSGTVNAGQRDVAICKLNNKYPAGTYTLSFDYVNNIGNTNWRPVLISKYNDSSWYSALISTNPATESSGHYVKTFTATEDFYIHLTLNCFGSASTTAVNSISNLQLELGSTATAYEPYDSNKTVYGGWVDLISGEVCETHAKYVFTGEEGFHIENSYQNKPFMISRDSRYYANMAFASSSNTNIVCNKLKGVSGRFHYLNDGCICTATSGVYSYILMNGKEIFGETNEECNQTLADWYANGTPLEMIAPLRETYYKTYSIAPTQLQTFLAQNNVWSNADYVEVEYDLHETQNILARKQFIIANQPHVEKLAAAPLQNFVTDMAAPLKECKVYFSPVQEGTGDPSPDNVRVINGWNGIKLLQCKENLWNKETATPQYINSGSGLSASDANNLTSDWIEVIPNKTYIYSYQPIIGANVNNNYTGLWTGAGFYKTQSTSDNAIARKTWLAPSSTNIQQIEITIPENCHYIRIGSRHLNIDGAWARFEPYEESQIVSTSINWTAEAGTVYGGYVDLVKGELVAEWAKFTLTRTNTTVRDRGASSTAITRYYMRTDFGLSWAKGLYNCICNRLRNAQANADFTVNYGWQLPGSNNVIYWNAPECATAEDADSIRDSTDYDFCIKLSAPITYQLTPQKISILRGANNIWASNGGDNIEIAYWKH